MTRAYLAFTDTGLALAKRLAVALPGSVKPGAGGMVFLLQNGQAHSLCILMR